MSSSEILHKSYTTTIGSQVFVNFSMFYSPIFITGGKKQLFFFICEK